ncbi:MAG TPA: YciI family protein [Dehalococcoidia bacterium]|nr:YciI family protein [Dehalococcoidia bacterium]
MTTLGARRNQSDRKQFLYRLKPTNPEMLARLPTPLEAIALHEHFEYLSQLAVIGKLLLAGRTTTDDETTFGIVIFEAKSEEDARRIMGNDPAIQEGVMEAELFPFRIAVQRSPNFAPRT